MNPYLAFQKCVLLEYGAAPVVGLCKKWKGHSGRKLLLGQNTGALRSPSKQELDELDGGAGSPC